MEQIDFNPIGLDEFEFCELTSPITTGWPQLKQFGFVPASRHPIKAVTARSRAESTCRLAVASKVSPPRHGPSSCWPRPPLGGAHDEKLAAAAQKDCWT